MPEIVEPVSNETPDTPESETPEEAQAGEVKLNQTVEIADAGPCRKHIKVVVPQADVDLIRKEVLKGVAKTAAVPGFRVGRVPYALVQKRFRDELTGQLRQRILMASLDQVARENDLEPINEPDIDPETLDIPEEGDFKYEFDVEVRPQFELPDYKGVRIQRPVRESSDAEIDRFIERLRKQSLSLEPKDGPAATGDVVTCDLEFTFNGEVVSSEDRVQLNLRSKLRFPDGELDGFDKLLSGAKPGDTREAQVKVSSEAARVDLRGEMVNVKFTVVDVSTVKLPELNDEFATGMGMSTLDQLRETVSGILENQVKLEQRRSARSQVLAKITESANWELPESLVRHQVENARRRDMLEMMEAGHSEEEIRARENSMLQNRVSATRQALKEHFVLDKIATVEKLEISPEEIEDALRDIASQSGQSLRKVRARIEKQGLYENLVAQLVEQKAVDFVLAQAEFDDIPAPKVTEDDVEPTHVSVSGAAAESEGADTEAEDA